MPIREDLLHLALCELRERSGETQRKIASDAGLDQTMLSRYERGATKPSWGSLVGLLDALGMDLADLQAAINKQAAKEQKSGSRRGKGTPDR